MRYFSGLVVLGLLVVMGNGCGAENFEPVSSPEPSASETPSDEPPVFLIKVDLEPDGSFKAVFPDGTEFRDLTTFSREAPPLIGAARRAGFRPEVEFGDNISAEYRKVLPQQSLPNLPDNAQPAVLGQWGKLTLTDGTGRHYLYGCISQDTGYYAIRLNYGSYKTGDFFQVFDAHFAKFSRPFQWCMGVYESVTGLSYCLCTPSFRPPVGGLPVEDHLQAYSVLRGVVIGTAVAVAAVGAAFVVSFAF